MSKKLDVYMPLIVGDWLKGTRGMRANVKGVYVGLLLHQWEKGFIPDSIEELVLIEPEVGSVWVSLSDKFPVVAPGRRQNSKCEEVRRFFEKQRKNGQNGGRPKNGNPKGNPNSNPKQNPNPNPPFELEYEYEYDNEIKEGGVGETKPASLDDRLRLAFDEIYLENTRMAWRHIDFDFEFMAFIQKVRGSPKFYADRDTDGLRFALQKQLRDAKPKYDATRKETTADLALKLAQRVAGTQVKPT